MTQRRIRPALSRPKDFDAFWEKTAGALAGIAPQTVRRRVDDRGTEGFILEEVSFWSLEDARINGYLLRSGKRARRPLVVHSHGYGSQSEIRWDWVGRGVDVLGLDIRGHGRSREALPELSPHGYVLTGASSPESYVIRGAVCDFIRAGEIGRALVGDAGRLVFVGSSFAGGLAVMAAAVSKLPDFLVVSVPTFGWSEGRQFFVRAGSGEEINRFLEARPESTEDLMVVLSYFDPINHAGHVTCPTLVGVGLEDIVVPAHTVYAIANHLAGPYEVLELPVSHTDRPEELLWAQFEDRWLRFASEGLPDAFGEEGRRYSKLV